MTGNKGKIKILCATFNGVQDIIDHALCETPKDGVYVGADSERYPYFDFEDYATEKRRYWNFVFALSKDELNEKLAKLKNTAPTKSGYNKLTALLSPMAYWGGDTHHAVEVV